MSRISARNFLRKSFKSVIQNFDYLTFYQGSCTQCQVLYYGINYETPNSHSLCLFSNMSTPSPKHQPTSKIFDFWLRMESGILVHYTVKTGFLLLRHKSLFLSTSFTQNCPETKRLIFEKLKYLYLKCMLFLKVSQHALIFETLLFLKVSRLILTFETTYYSNVIWDVLIFEITCFSKMIQDDFIFETLLQLFDRCSFYIIAIFAYVLHIYIYIAIYTFFFAIYC